jgi:lysozyme
MLVALAGFFVAAGAIATLGLFQGWLRYESPFAHRYSVRGIDVSHHQGNIIWESVIQDDVQFVFIKATEGGDWKDPRFHDNWNGAAKANLRRGAYHFFTFCRGGAEQADNFIATVPLDIDALPPVIDLEFGGNCKDFPDNDVVIRELDIFTDRVEAHYGKPPIVYVTAEAHEIYLADLEPLRWPIWYRSLMVEPDLSGGGVWTYWQYSNRGRVDGIQGPVDLNVFRGTLDDLR